MNSGLMLDDVIDLDKSGNIRIEWDDYYYNTVHTIAVYSHNIVDLCDPLRDVLGMKLPLSVDDIIEFIINYDDDIHYGMNESKFIEFMNDIKVRTYITNFVDFMNNLDSRVRNNL